LIISTIRQAEDTESARIALMTAFDLSEAQAKAILELQLRRIASLERLKIEQEYTEATERIAYLEDLLANDYKVRDLIKTDLAELTVKFGDPRKTALDHTSDANFNETDLIREEEVLISITRRGFIKRTPSALYRSQHRGGRGILGMRTREEDAVEHLVNANSLGHVLLFTNKGKVYAERAFALPEADRNAKGTLISSLIQLEPDEHITTVTHVRNFDDGGYFVFCTQLGKIKRVPVKQFKLVRANGLIAINLNADDTLKWVRHTSGHDDLLIVSAKGRALRFPESRVRIMGRQATGVNAMRMRFEGDRIASMDVIDETAKTILIVTAKGFGKQTPVEQYPIKGRNGSGVLTMNPRAIEIVGEIVSAQILRENEDITMITADGLALRTPASSARLASRATKGVRLIKMSKKDNVVSVVVIQSLPEEKLAEEEELDVLVDGVVLNGSADGDEALIELDPELDLVDLDVDDDLDALDDEIDDDLEDDDLDDEDDGEDDDADADDGVDDPELDSN
jgi:DNA gyrase subunit A